VLTIKHVFADNHHVQQEQATQKDVRVDLGDNRNALKSACGAMGISMKEGLRRAVFSWLKSPEVKGAMKCLPR